MNDPDSISAAPNIAALYPPPYRLRCDVGLFPMLIDEASAERLAPETPLGGRTLLWFITARYYQGWYGPDQLPYPSHDHGGDLYREMGYALAAGFPNTLAFGRLWVDAPDAVPLELGWYYGFPKQQKIVKVTESNQGIRWEATSLDGQPLASIAAQVVLLLPGWLLRLFASARVIFPASRTYAGMRFEQIGRASLVRVKSAKLTYLEQRGVYAKPRLGMWLHDARLFLGPPQKLPGAVL